jgi:hypothetical protein
MEEESPGGWWMMDGKFTIKIIKYSGFNFFQNWEIYCELQKA